MEHEQIDWEKPLVDFSNSPCEWVYESVCDSEMGNLIVRISDDESFWVNDSGHGACNFVRNVPQKRMLYIAIFRGGPGYFTDCSLDGEELDQRIYEKRSQGAELVGMFSREIE